MWRVSRKKRNSSVVLLERPAGTARLKRCRLRWTDHKIGCDIVEWIYLAQEDK